MRTTEARVFAPCDDEEDGFLPEGPRELSPAGVPGVAWVNIQTAPDATRGAVHSLGWGGDERGVWNLPGRPGFLLPTSRPGVVLVGMEKHLGTLELESNEWVPLVKIPDADPRTIVNDGEVVPGGKAVVFGTKDTRFKEPVAHLYLYTVDDNRVSVLADRQLCSNGKVFRTDDRGLVLFDIDTPTRKVVRYRLDVAARTATADGVALDLADHAGFPDGMCDCGDGTAVVAFYNPDLVAAGRAVRFDLATGRAVEAWTTPGAPRVTCPLLVSRPDGVKLILTTATEGMPADMREKCPNAGCLFIADTALATCPESEAVRLP